MSRRSASEEADDRSGRTSGKKSGRAFIPRSELGLFSLPLAVLAIAGLVLSGNHAATGGSSTGEPEGVIFVLTGPNDGEPINCRTVKLRLATDFREAGTIAVHVNDQYVWSRSLQVGAARDPASGLLVTTIEVDIEDAARRTAQTAILSGSATPVRLTVYLYASATTSLVTYDEWLGCAYRPSVELILSRVPGAELGLRCPEGKVPAALHPLKDDAYYFVLEATRRDLLRRSPEDPRALRDATIVSAGACFQLGTETSNRSLLFLDKALPGSTAQVYVVLWTYDTTRGWKSSPVVAVPRG